MKKLKDIIEAQNFLVNRKLKNRQQQYEYFPKEAEELKRVIINLLKQGITDLNNIDLSAITDMYAIFWDVNIEIEVESIDISEWDVSHVTSMDSMFYGCENVECDLSKWDVSNVQKFNWMFCECKKFNNDLSKWNVSKAIKMQGMFDNCKMFNCDLSNWDVSNVKDMRAMFNKCTKLKKNNKIPDWYKN